MERQYEGHQPTLQPARWPPVDTQPDAAIAYRPLDPRVRQLWWIVGAAVVLVMTLVAWVPGLVAGSTWRNLPPLIVLVVGAPAAALIPWLRYQRWRFALREHDLWIRHGVLWLNTSVIPYARLQFVDTTQGPLDRALGLAQLVVHTAAPGTSGRLPGLALDDAEALREKLARVRVTTHDV
jgi:membrane protein YdbS with pleckstrin-like domain